MLFNSAAYLIFLPITAIIYWLLPFRFRTAFLVAASYYFYMSWKPIYGLLIAGMTLFNYLAGLKLASEKTHPRLVLGLAIAANLILLGYFKYTYFAIDSANTLFSALHQGHLSYPASEIILPLGISFFVFEFIHYLMDIYRGKEPIKGPLEFALFPSFFPTQIAGPIKRYHDFVPQLHRPLKLSLKEFDEGVELILWGLFKKVLIADNLAVVVDRTVLHPEALSTLDIWLVFYAFAFQVYMDFSGYTDIARGSAAIMGFKVPKNFDLPYISGSMNEFWKRWHISLSTWLRDYLFIPLGGSKYGKWGTYRNLLITMTLCGLWHGAALHYVLFGFAHGVLVTGNRLWRDFVEADWNPLSKTLVELTATKPYHVFAVILNFQVYILTLVFFRVSDLRTMGMCFEKLLGLGKFAEGLARHSLTVPTIEGPAHFTFLPVALVLLIAGHFFADYMNKKYQGEPGTLLLPPKLVPFKAVYLACLAVLLLLFSPDGTPSFIYFQF